MVNLTGIVSKALSFTKQTVSATSVKNSGSSILGPFQDVLKKTRGMRYDNTYNREEPMTRKEYLAMRTNEMAVFDTAWTAENYPDVMLWFLPIYSAQMVEIASSQDVLKYRSVGGQFLAHQKGGSFAVRIDAKLKGRDASSILTALQILQISGDAREIMTPGTSKIELKPTNVNRVFDEGTDVEPVNKHFSSKPLDNGWTDETFTSVSDYDWMRSTWHRTFPIITRSEILFDMYIESLIYYRSNDEDDHNVINVSMFCRKFTPPPRVVSNFLYNETTPTVKRVGPDATPPYNETSANQTNSTNSTIKVDLNQKYKYTVYDVADKISRVVRTQDMMPTSEVDDFIINIIHKDGMTRTRFYSNYENIKSRSIRDTGVYSFIFDVLNRKGSSIVKPVVDKITGYAALKNRPIVVQRIDVGEVGYVTNLDERSVSTDKFEISFSNAPLKSTNIEGSNFSAIDGRFVILYYGDFTDSGFTGKKYYLKRDAYYSFRSKNSSDRNIVLYPSNTEVFVWVYSGKFKDV